MKTYARIENNVVVELLTTGDNISEMFHPALVWAECSGDIKEGWGYDGGNFTPPVAPR